MMKPTHIYFLLASLFTHLAWADGLTAVMGKWATTFYGFAELDNIYDSTQSFGDLAGVAPVASATTYAGQNGRMTMSVRNSRMGFRMTAPEILGFHPSAVAEFDFRGNVTGTESAIFSNSALRIRHMFMKFETPILDILMGQTWGLFGWQSIYHPNSVEYQGLPGQLFSRVPQLRISKLFHMSDVSLELALAMVRPAQRDSAVPEGQAGLRITLDNWKATFTPGPIVTGLHPLSLALSSTIRRIVHDNAGAANAYTAWGAAVDMFIPILPATAQKRGNSLSLVGEYVYGDGIGDEYSAMAGTPIPGMDPGIGIINGGNFQLINRQSYRVGAQYYFPWLDGRMWVVANYGHMQSSTTGIASEDWADGNFFVDVLNGLRIGLEYAYFHQPQGNNHRVQLSTFYLF